jgi:hypothetical protein
MSPTDLLEDHQMQPLSQDAQRRLTQTSLIAADCASAWGHASTGQAGPAEDGARDVVAPARPIVRRLLNPSTRVFRSWRVGHESASYEVACASEGPNRDAAAVPRQRVGGDG